MKPIKPLATFLAGNQLSHTPIRERIYSSLASFVAILIMVVVVHYFSVGISFSLPVLASMGASAFLLFIVPHGTMSQPWPVIGGHLLSAAIGMACAQWRHSLVATAVAIFAMHWLHGPHPTQRINGDDYCPRKTGNSCNRMAVLP